MAEIREPDVVAVHDVHVWQITSGWYRAHVEVEFEVFARAEVRLSSPASWRMFVEHLTRTGRSSRPAGRGAE